MFDQYVGFETMCNGRPHQVQEIGVFAGGHVVVTVVAVHRRVPRG